MRAPGSPQRAGAVIALFQCAILISPSMTKMQAPGICRACLMAPPPASCDDRRERAPGAGSGLRLCVGVSAGLKSEERSASAAMSPVSTSSSPSRPLSAGSIAGSLHTRRTGEMSRMHAEGTRRQRRLQRAKGKLSRGVAAHNGGRGGFNIVYMCIVIQLVPEGHMLQQTRLPEGRGGNGTVQGLEKGGRTIESWCRTPMCDSKCVKRIWVIPEADPVPPHHHYLIRGMATCMHPLPLFTHPLCPLRMRCAEQGSPTSTGELVSGP